MKIEPSRRIKIFSTKVIKILLGNALITFAYSFITIPNEIITGGITGFSMIISDLTTLDIKLAANLSTMTLLLLCFIFLGKEYFINSLISSVFYMGLLSTLMSLQIQINLGPLLNIVVAGILVGVGYKFCIESHASTAGFDVIALILNKYNNSISVGLSIRYISIIIMILGVYRFGLISVVLGIILTIIQTTVLNTLERND